MQPNADTWPPASGSHLDVRPDLNADPWDDIDGAAVRPGQMTRIGMLPGNVSDGRASAAVLGQLPDGTTVVLEATWELLSVAVAAIAGSPAGQREGLL